MLTMENVEAFEKADDDLDKVLDYWWRVYHKLKSEQSKLHDDFRKEHSLTGSNFHSIADWRWKNKENS